MKKHLPLLSKGLLVEELDVTSKHKVTYKKRANKQAERMGSVWP